jgi:hypothetical protein
MPPAVAARLIEAKVRMPSLPATVTIRPRVERLLEQVVLRNRLRGASRLRLDGPLPWW